MFVRIPDPPSQEEKRAKERLQRELDDLRRGQAQDERELQARLREAEERERAKEKELNRLRQDYDDLLRSAGDKTRDLEGEHFDQSIEHSDWQRLAKVHPQLSSAAASAKWRTIWSASGATARRSSWTSWRRSARVFARSTPSMPSATASRSRYVRAHHSFVFSAAPLLALFDLSLTLAQIADLEARLRRAIAEGGGNPEELDRLNRVLI